MAHLAGPSIDAFAHSGPLAALIKALDAVAMAVALKAIHVGIERTPAVRAIQAGKFLRETMAVAGLVIACSLSVAHAVLQLPVLVGDGAQALLNGAIQSTITMITVTSTRIVVACAMAIALLCAVHTMP